MKALTRAAVWFAGDGKFVRYLLTGATISLLDLGLFTLLSVVFAWNAIFANIVSTIISICVSYLINRVFVFRAGRATWRTFLSFSGVTLFTGLIVQSLVIWGIITLADAFDPAPSNEVVLTVAKILAMGIGAIANYLGYRFAFRRRRD